MLFCVPIFLLSKLTFLIPGRVDPIGYLSLLQSRQASRGHFLLGLVVFAWTSAGAAYIMTVIPKETFRFPPCNTSTSKSWVGKGMLQIETIMHHPPNHKYIRAPLG